jgi:hypothetical protein
MELPNFTRYINFSRHWFCCFTVAPLFVLDKSTVCNKCLQHPCFKKLCKIAQASKNSDSNAQHFLSDFLRHSWFHSMLFELPGYQFPYNVMNRWGVFPLKQGHLPNFTHMCPRISNHEEPSYHFVGVHMFAWWQTESNVSTLLAWRLEELKFCGQHCTCMPRAPNQMPHH